MKNTRHNWFLLLLNQLHAAQRVALVSWIKASACFYFLTFLFYSFLQICLRGLYLRACLASNYKQSRLCLIGLIRVHHIPSLPLTPSPGLTSNKTKRKTSTTTTWIKLDIMYYFHWADGLERWYSSWFEDNNASVFLLWHLAAHFVSQQTVTIQHGSSLMVSSFSDHLSPVTSLAVKWTEQQKWANAGRWDIWRSC